MMRGLRLKARLRHFNRIHPRIGFAIRSFMIFSATFGGAYGYVSYILTGEHIGWDRKTGQLGRVKPFENFFIVNTCGDGCAAGWGAWGVCARYSFCDLTDQDIAGGVSNETTLGLNWYWNEFTHMQFNYVHGILSDHEPVAGYTSGSFDSIGARFIVFF